MILAQAEQIGNSLSTWTENNGLAVVLLFMVLISLGFASWKILNWAAANVVIPMRDSFISHLSRTDKTMESMEGTLTGIHAEMQTARSDRESLQTKHDLLHAKIDEIGRRKCQSTT